MSTLYAESGGPGYRLWRKLLLNGAEMVIVCEWGTYRWSLHFGSDVLDKGYADTLADAERDADRAYFRREVKA